MPDSPDLAAAYQRYIEECEESERIEQERPEVWDGPRRKLPSKAAAKMILERRRDDSGDRPA